MAEEGVPIQLEIGYLKDIVNALSESNFSRSRWLPLGLQLGLIQPTLKDIGAMCNEDPEKCLCECLTCWLKGADKVNESGGPTVESLATALNKIGDGLAAARTTELLKKLFSQVSQKIIQEDSKQSNALLQSVDTVHVGQEIVNEQDQITVTPQNPRDLLTKLLQSIEQMEDLEQIACTLQDAFHKLPVAVKHSLQNNGIGLNDVILLIDQKLKHDGRIKLKEEMEKYRQELRKIRSVDDLFLFLSDNDFYGYLNYVLLKKISELANDQSIASSFEEYEKSYVKLISKATFKDIVSVFHQNPDLKSAAPIGLPRIIFRLEKHWQNKYLPDFIDESNLPHFESFLLHDLRKNCIIITYAVFPSVLSDVLEYLKSSAIQQKFHEIGVSVELPQDPVRKKGVLPKLMTSDFLNGKPTVDELHEHVNIGSKWYKFGALLYLDTSADLDNIDQQYKDDQTKVLKMFELWLSTTPNPTRRKIIDKLLDPIVSENVLAENYEKALVEMQKEVVIQIIQHHSEILSKLTLPVEIVQTLYTEEVISEETFDVMESSKGSLAGGPLRALSSTISDDLNQIKVFCSVLLKSEETVRIANDILKEYNSMFPPSLPNQSSINKDVLANPTYNTTSTTAQKLHSTFDQIRETYGSLIHTVSPLIFKSVPSLQEFKTFLQRFMSELKPQLSIAESFDDVMELVEDKCTIINIVCLEAIVDTFNILEAVQHIKEYQATIDTFCNEVKLSVCENQSFLTSQSTLLKCETVEFVLEWEPDDYTLTQIRDLLTEAFKDNTKRVQIRIIKRGNSVIVTCYAPRHIMDVLIMEAEKNLNLLKNMGLMKLTIGYCTVCDECTKDKEMKEHEEETKEKFTAKMELRSYYETHTSMNENQSTLSEKLKLLQGQSKAKTLEIERLTRYKKSTDKVIVEKEEEIEKLTREKEATDQVLVEKEEEIEKLTREKEGYPQIKNVNIQGNNTQTILADDSLSEMFEIAICALIGGEFELPKGSILVSVVYSLSMTKQIEKPLTLKIQHCVNLKTRAQADCLYFVTTLSHRTLPYQFSLVEGGQFDPGSRYGSINISESCNFLVAIVAKMNKQPHKTQKTNMESTLPSKELSSQSMNELVSGGSPFLSFIYTGMISYEKKDGDWIAIFSVMKDLRALLTYTKKGLDNSCIEFEDPVCFEFSDENKYVEFILSQEPPPGWSIKPMIDPCQLWQMDIDKFGSSSTMSMSSCQFLIHADNSPDTYEHLVYPIEMKGITPPMNITIHRRRSDVIDFREIWRLIRKVLRERHADLPDLLRPSLDDLATKMFAAGLISDDVQKKPTYINIIGDFLTGINSVNLKSYTELQEYIKKFLMILNNLGGDCAHVSNTLQVEWTEIIKRELHIELNFIQNKRIADDTCEKVKSSKYL